MEETFTPGDAPDREELPAEAWEAAEGNGLQEERRRRLQEYHAQTLANPEPLTAVLGSINAGLMRVAFDFDQALQENLAGEPPTIAQIMEHAEALELQLKITRQIDRLAQLELHTAHKARAASEKLPSAPR